MYKRQHFNNTVEYRSYKLIFPTVKGDYDAMQIAEIQFFNSTQAPLLTPNDEVIAIHDPPRDSLMLHAGPRIVYYSDQLLRTDFCPDAPGEATLGGGVGCPDSDGDGWADPINDRPFVEGDMCPDEPGEANTPTGRGCPDADEDGWADFEDDLPYDEHYHLDSDGDGVPDEHDAFPHNAFFEHEGDVANLVCFLLVAGAIFALAKRKKNQGPPVPEMEVPEAIVVGQLTDGDSSTEKDTFW